MRLIFVCMWHYSRYSYYLRAMFPFLELLSVRLVFVCMWHYSRYSYYLRAMFTLLRAPECAASICVHVALQ